MSDGNNLKWDHLSTLVENQMKTHNIPGVGIGVYKSGESLSLGFGVTSVENPLPVTDKTFFQIGSITKTFTCAAIMRLVELGMLDLETPVRSIFPEFKVSDEKTSSSVSIYHLLTHTAGWLGDFFIGTGSGDDAMAKYVSRMSELEQVSPLGSYFSYNNSGFHLLGYLIELVTGKSYEESIRELVLEPLGLNDCLFEPSQVMIKRFSVGHRVIDGAPQVAVPWAIPRAAYPAGGLCSNVIDMMRYAQFFIDRGINHTGERILKAETIESMQSTKATIWKEKEFIGLSWFINVEADKKVNLHGGGTVGQVCSLQIIPEDELAFVILTNANLGHQLIGTVSKWILREFAEIEIKDSKPIDVPVEKKKECEGRYILPKIGYTDIALLGDTLVAQDTYTGGFPTEDTPPRLAPPPYRMAFTEADNLVILDGEGKDFKAQIIRDDDGELSFMRMGRRLHIRSD